MTEAFISPFISNSLFFNSESSHYPKSPLRYPGGKARAVSQILRFIPKDISCLVSPFFGGGSIEIAIAHLGIKVLGYDIFQPLVDFWSSVLTNPKLLADEVRKYFPLEKKDFYDLQKKVITDPFLRGTIFYVLNRSSFSGSTLSGGMSPGHPRFTKSSIKYLEEFDVKGLTVQLGDFKDTIPGHPDAFLYLDPPYLISNSLYGRKGNTHKDFDHASLFAILDKRGGWLLSYNDCAELRSTYKRYRILEPTWKYGMSHDKASREILILSDDLPDLDYAISAKQLSWLE